jgi:hypothetical protein
LYSKIFKDVDSAIKEAEIEAAWSTLAAYPLCSYSYTSAAKHEPSTVTQAFIFEAVDLAVRQAEIDAAMAILSSYLAPRLSEPSPPPSSPSHKCSKPFTAGEAQRHVLQTVKTCVLLEDVDESVRLAEVEAAKAVLASYLAPRMVETAPLRVLAA